jgi:hypothetical protein
MLQGKKEKLVMKLYLTPGNRKYYRVEMGA